ncbi:MAG: chorismate mutase [Anaerolineae bacterium]
MSQTEPAWRTSQGQTLMCRGVRGATTAEANTKEAILKATRELFTQMIELNGIQQEDVASVWFTTTADLNMEYPALAARQLGWHDAALMCSHEMNVPQGLPMAIRILIHWNTVRSPKDIQHVYIRGAVNLRPDRSIELRAETQTFEG